MLDEPFYERMKKYLEVELKFAREDVEISKKAGEGNLDYDAGYLLALEMIYSDWFSEKEFGN